MKSKNNIYTPSYFMKRMKDSGYGIWKIFDKYGPHDSRYWSMMIDPGGFSVWITCYFNKEELNDVYFELDDGGIRIPKKLLIKTRSIETIISNLISFGIDNNAPFDSSLININMGNDPGEKTGKTAETAEETLAERQRCDAGR